MVRKSKKGIVGKRTIPGSGFGTPGPGIDFVEEHLTSGREIEEAVHKESKKEGLE